MEEQKKQDVASHFLESEFVTYEQALALKELGFNERCIGRYCIVTEWEEPTGEILLQFIDCEVSEKILVKAPLKQQVFRWFRGKYGLEVILCPDAINNPEKKLREYKIISYDKSMVLEPIAEPHWWTREGCFKTYEEAENACIDKLISIAKQQDK
jgi:hypothetical protein